MKIIGWIIGITTLTGFVLAIGVLIFTFGISGIYGIFHDNSCLCLLSCLVGIVILALLLNIRKVFFEPRY
jgi:hypothetical protein